MTDARVIVTGGTGGLGRAVTLALLRTGARVAVPYRDARAFEALAGEAGHSSALFGATADISDAVAAEAFVGKARAELGGLSGLAALAGAYAGSGPVESSDPGEWRAMQAANLDSAYHICRAALPALQAAGRASIVLVSSRLVSSGGGGAAAYAVSKAGVEALTRAMAAENRARGVRVNCVAPGTIDTVKNRTAMPTANRGGWTAPEAIAEVVLFLLSAASQPITGCVLPVDAT